MMSNRELIEHIVRVSDKDMSASYISTDGKNTVKIAVEYFDGTDEKCVQEGLKKKTEIDLFSHYIYDGEELDLMIYADCRYGLDGKLLGDTPIESVFPKECSEDVAKIYASAYEDILDKAEQEMDEFERGEI